MSTDFRRPGVPGLPVVTPMGAIAPATFVPAGDGVPVGTLITWAGKSSGPGPKWLLAEGLPLLKDDFPELFEALGTVWGVPADPDYFATPDPTGRFLLTAGSIGGGAGFYFAHTSGGTEKHTLTTAEMPAHTHPPAPGFEGIWQADTAAAPVVQAGGNFTGNNFQMATGSAGGGLAHNNMPPYIAMDTYLKVRP